MKTIFTLIFLMSSGAYADECHSILYTRDKGVMAIPTYAVADNDSCKQMIAGHITRVCATEVFKSTTEVLIVVNNVAPGFAALSTFTGTCEKPLIGNWVMKFDTTTGGHFGDSHAFDMEDVKTHDPLANPLIEQKK